MEIREVFESPEIVEYYRTLDGLQEAEKRILAILRVHLANIRMLDIGVGAGRTTVVFAPLVSEYVAVDSSDAMVRACNDRFRDSNPSWAFRVGDARALNDFEDGSFGFVLFSFNGIDCMSHEDRLRTLCEIRRVLEPGGFLAFSTHNLNSSFESRFSVRKARGIASATRLMVQTIKFRLFNPKPDVLRVGDYAMIRDGAGSFRAAQYYVKPRAQRTQLQTCGFRNIRVFSHPTGRELMEGEEGEAQDAWLYYLCRRPDSEVESRP